MKAKKEPENLSEEDVESTIPSPVSSVVSNKCLDWATVSKLRWKKSLDKGCLPHGLNEKAQLYSHTRVFTNLELPVEISEAYSSDGSGLFKTKSGQINEKNTGSPHPDDCHIIADLAATDFKSPVIVEDSMPPRVEQEAAVVVFTLDEFFDYLSRCQWKPQVKVRVIGGKLLQVLIHSLTWLEKTGKIRAMTEYALLNNEYLQDDHKDMEMIKTMEDELKPKLSLDWHAEKLMVKLVYYSCLEQAPSADDDCLVKEATKRKLLPYVIPGPARANHLHLPDKLVFDNLGVIDPQVKIKKLETEMDICRRRIELEKRKELAATAKSNDNKNTKQNKEDDLKEKEMKGKGMKALDESEIENIEEDPFLFHDSHSTFRNKQVVDIVDSVSESISAPASAKLSAVISNKLSVEKAESKASVKMDSVEEVKEVNLQSSSESTVPPLEVKESLPKAKESNISCRELSFPESHEEEEVKGERLFLPDDQLYVAALYLPVQRNLLSVKAKLKKANHKRQADCLRTARNALNAIQTNLSFDINTRFKSLVIAKEKARRKAAASKYVKKPSQKPNDICIKDKWEIYYNDQKEMEMRVMTHSDIQSNLLRRLQEEIQRKADNPDQYNLEQTAKIGKGKPSGKGNMNKNARQSLAPLPTTGRVAADNNNSSRSFISHKSGKKISREIPEKTSSYALCNLVAQNKIPIKSVFTTQNLKHMVSSLAESDKQQHIINTCQSSLKVASHQNRNISSNGIGRVNETRDQMGRQDSQNRKNFVSEKPEKYKSLEQSDKLPTTTDKRTLKTMSISKNVLLKEDTFSLSCKTNKSVSFTAAVYRSNQRSVSKGRAKAMQRKTSSASSLPRLGKKKIKRRHISEHDLPYQSVCLCPECSYDDEILSPLRPAVRWGAFTYPLKLGHIQPCQDLPHTTDPLAENIPQESILSLRRNKQGHFVGMDQFEENVLERTQQRVLVAMNDVVVCKEIISSSTGNTFTTVTFSGDVHLIQ